MSRAWAFACDAFFYVAFRLDGVRTPFRLTEGMW